MYGKNSNLPASTAAHHQREKKNNKLSCTSSHQEKCFIVSTLVNLNYSPWILFWHFAINMPFVCETIPAGELQRKAATPFSKDHITISPLGRWQSPLGKRLLLTPCFMPTSFRQYADVIHNFEVYADDVWLISFPTANSDAIAEMVWLLMNQLNMEIAEEVPLSERCVFVE